MAMSAVGAVSLLWTHHHHHFRFTSIFPAFVYDQKGSDQSDKWMHVKCGGEYKSLNFCGRCKWMITGVKELTYFSRTTIWW